MHKLLLLLVLGAFGVAMLPTPPAHGAVVKLIVHKHHHHRHHHHHKK